MKKLGALLRNLWAQEPALVAGALALAVSEGVLTSSQASALTDVIAGLVQALAAFGIRSQVSPHSA